MEENQRWWNLKLFISVKVKKSKNKIKTLEAMQARTTKSRT